MAASDIVLVTPDSGVIVTQVDQKFLMGKRSPRHTVRSERRKRLKTELGRMMALKRWVCDGAWEGDEGRWEESRQTGVPEASC